MGNMIKRSRHMKAVKNKIRLKYYRVKVFENFINFQSNFFFLFFYAVLENNLALPKLALCIWHLSLGIIINLAATEC